METSCPVVGHLRTCHFLPFPGLWFAATRPLLRELCQRSGNVTLVKIKSHTGCLLSERADEQAEFGRDAEGPVLCPGPQKESSRLLARLGLATRGFVEKCAGPLTSDSASSSSL